MDNVINPEAELKKQIEDLKKITRSIRLNALFASIIAGINIIGGISLLSTVYLNIFSRSDVTLILEVYTALLILVLFLLISYEAKKKRANVLYEEISDELQWHVGKSNSSVRSETRPDLAARIALRSFDRTTDLPLVGGKSAPIIYSIFNIAIYFLVFLSISDFLLKHKI